MEATFKGEKHDKYDTFSVVIQLHADGTYETIVKDFGEVSDRALDFWQFSRHETGTYTIEGSSSLYFSPSSPCQTTYCTCEKASAACTCNAQAKQCDVPDTFARYGVSFKDGTISGGIPAACGFSKNPWTHPAHQAGCPDAIRQ